MADNPNISFSLTSSIPPTEAANLPKAIISSPGYESIEVIPYKGDGTAKTDLGIISLIPLATALEQDKIRISQLSLNQIKELTKDKLNADFFIQEKLRQQIQSLQAKLIPSVLTMISEFGITKATDIISKGPNAISDVISNRSTCPDQIKLNNLVKKKNQLVKQLNNILNIIDNATKALGVTGGIIESLDIAYNVLKNLPIPSSTGITGVPGLPINVILLVQDNKERLDTLITKLKNINAGVLAILVALRQVLLLALQLLNLLDKLVQKCYPEADQEQIAQELIILTQQQSQQQSPVVINANGFEMGVETENTNKPLKRRRAIARNKQGVVMLKGEWSFSSIDQILIDELVFYIQTNNLKAD